MAHPLYLTKDEQTILHKLPAGVMGDWKLEEETLTFTDSEISREVRMRNLKLEHPALKKLQEEAAGKNYTKDDVAKMAESIDLSGLSEKDLIELAFAWGPDVFSAMIATALPAITSVEELGEVAQLAGIRHGLLLSFASSVR